MTIPGQSEPYTGPVVEYAGYEGVQSFAIALTKVTSSMVDVWMNAGAPLLNTTGAWKAAYGTFLTGLLLEYCHDQVADLAASKYNVTWARTSPIAVATIDDPHNTYLTLECDHGMGMTAVGTPKNVYAFNFACSSAISPLEYWVMNHMFPGLLLNGSVTMGLGGMLLNGTALDIYTSNGYVVVKAINSTDKILVIDPETGVVRDILPNSVIFGAYCYYDLQTDLAVDLGRKLISNNPFEVPGWIKFLPGLCINPDDMYDFPEVSILPVIISCTVFAQDSDFFTQPANTEAVNILSNLPSNSTELAIGTLTLFLSNDYPTYEEFQEACWKASNLLMELAKDNDVEKRLENGESLQSIIDEKVRSTAGIPDDPRTNDDYLNVGETIKNQVKDLKDAIANGNTQKVLIIGTKLTLEVASLPLAITTIYLYEKYKKSQNLKK